MGKRLLAKEFANIRERLLASIKSIVENDHRILGAWLTGNYATHEVDDFSDIDISVIADPMLMDNIFSIDEKNSLERQAAIDFLEQFGKISNLHSRANHAPESGKIISVLYEKGIMIDWLFLPLKNAKRPIVSQIIFQKVDIEFEEDMVIDNIKNANKLERKISFFWMMAAITAKAYLRGDDLRFNIFIEQLIHTSEEIKDLAKGKKYEYKAKKNLALLEIKTEQKNTLLRLCNHVNSLSPSKRQLKTIDFLLDISELQ